MLNPKPVSHTNFENIFEFFKYADKQMSLAQFASTYLWRQSTGLLYDIQDGFLFLFEKKYNYSSPLPLGEGDIFEALDKCKEYKDYVDGNNYVYCIPEDKVNLFEKKYEIEELEFFAEYVYSVEELINLSGKKFHTKKNHLNAFVKNNEYEYIRIEKKDIPLVLKLQEEWNAKREFSSDLNVETRAINEILNYDIGVDFRIGAIVTNGRIVAFSIGEQISDDMACVYFEKADVDVRGSYAVMNNEFLKNEFSHLKYVNRQEDLGIPGLIKAKESYRPLFKVKNYCIKL